MNRAQKTTILFLSLVPGFESSQKRSSWSWTNHITWSKLNIKKIDDVFEFGFARTQWSLIENILFSRDGSGSWSSNISVSKF